MKVTVKIASGLLAGWLLAACAPLPMTAPPPPPSIVGRWEVQGTPGVHIPHSFFWFTMDYLEFREEGTVWGLMAWPPDGGGEIRLNKTAQYVLRGDNQLEITGSCRHQDPCTGVYTLTRTGDALQIADGGRVLNLQWVGPPAETPPRPAPGPAPSPTPVAESPLSTANALLFVAWDILFLKRRGKKPRPNSRQYGHPRIRATLRAMSFGKCFYCERKLGEAKGEIEHYNRTLHRSRI